MSVEKITLPFSLPNVYGGFGQVKGLVNANRERIQINFQTEDAIVGFFKSGPKYLEIPLEEIESITFKKRWWGNRFILRVFNLAVINDFPKPANNNVPAGEIRMNIKRADRERAAKIESFINLRLSEIGLDRSERNDLY
ncbi:MAG: hypothetical protein AAFY71_03675 [Bacteroidota bacterium]